MRHLSAVLFVAAAGLLPAGAQPPIGLPVQETFLTADGVQLKGLFHKSPVGMKQNDAVVVLLYSPGPEKSMLKGDWDPLIDTLNASGFHVFRFDWRGHGDSTLIADPLGDGIPFNGFWTNLVTGPQNQKYVRGYGKNPVKADIRKGDVIHPAYFPVYVNDLAAVRIHLDRLNDKGLVNTSTIYLVGAGDAANLGFLWLASEWQRPAVNPPAAAANPIRVAPWPGMPPPAPAGVDIAGAVWLSASRSGGGTPVSTPAVCVKAAPRLRDENKMLFLYGADDAAAKRESEEFFNKVLVAGGNKQFGVLPVNQTFLFPVAKTKLNGIALLGKDDVTKTETKTLEYLAALQKARGGPPRVQRNWVVPYYIDVNHYLNLR